MFAGNSWSAKVMKVCPHCYASNMGEHGRSYHCKQCYRLVEPYLIDRDCDREVQTMPEENDFLKMVRNHALILRNHAGNLHSSRITELFSTLKKFFNKTVITEEDISTACQIDPKFPQQYQDKGYMIQ